MDESVRELHRDLAGKFRRHGPRIEQLWRSLGQEQREKALRDGAADGEVLKSPTDTSMGDVYKFIPEWNLRDITTPSSDFLLDLLKHRATTDLLHQYTTGVNGGPGDHAHIVDMMQNKNLALVDAHKHKNRYTLFLDEGKYGESIKITAGKQDEILTTMMPAVRAQMIVPQSVGNLILKRQLNILQSLNIMIEDILDTANPSRTKKGPSRKLETATAAMSKLSLHTPPTKVDLADLTVGCADQVSAVEDRVTLISTEPTVLAHQVNLCFFTRPELVADEKGRILPVHTDKYISGAVFDAVREVVKTTSIWSYISRLLVMLKSCEDKQMRALVLQELSNASHLEYSRAQASMKRDVATGSGGSKWFKRASTVPKDGIVRISLKRDPESLTVENPQLHYMLRLCQDETTWARSVEWLQRLAELHRAHPLEREKMTEPEYESLGDVAVIATFLQSLSTVAKLPTANNKAIQSFGFKMLALENELRQLKTGVDLGNFAIPIDNLLEPGMATGALKTLDAYVMEKTGSKLGSLYQDLVEDCVSNIRSRHEQNLTKLNQTTAEYVTPFTPDDPVSVVQQRRQKEKTRPAHSSVYDMMQTDISESPSEQQSTESKDLFQVKASTFAVFSSLLSRSSAARGSISWDAFTAAMSDIGFSVVPKVGSIYTFNAPSTLAVQRDLTLHRPHQSHIEGHILLIYSRRLSRVYGWDESTFVEV
jgi:hypothetical protein